MPAIFVVVEGFPPPPGKRPLFVSSISSPCRGCLDSSQFYVRLLSEAAAGLDLWESVKKDALVVVIHILFSVGLGCFVLYVLKPSPRFEAIQ